VRWLCHNAADDDVCLHEVQFLWYRSLIRSSKLAPDIATARGIYLCNNKTKEQTLVWAMWIQSCARHVLISSHHSCLGLPNNLSPTLLPHSYRLFYLRLVPSLCFSLRTNINCLLFLFVLQVLLLLLLLLLLLFYGTSHTNSFVACCNTLLLINICCIRCG
jgi:hypothetical protein